MWLIISGTGLPTSISPADNGSESILSVVANLQIYDQTTTDCKNGVFCGRFAGVGCSVWLDVHQIVKRITALILYEFVHVLVVNRNTDTRQSICSMILSI